MAKLDEFKRHLKVGKVYRRAEMVSWSSALDRHISLMVKIGFLEKQARGLYYVPKKSVFGNVPANEKLLVRSFLKGGNFLITSPNAYNSLGVGTTQLYNKRIVYNHKRHGEFKLGGRTFFFHLKQNFPSKATEEFLLVDLVNNLGSLAEDSTDILKSVLARANTMDAKKLKQCIANYGSAKAKMLLVAVIK